MNGFLSGKSVIFKSAVMQGLPLATLASAITLVCISSPYQLSLPYLPTRFETAKLQNVSQPTMQRRPKTKTFTGSGYLTDQSISEANDIP
jgi:hypothetical protein